MYLTPHQEVSVHNRERGYRILQVSKKDTNDYEMFSPIDTPTITLPCQIRREHRERNKKIVSARQLRFLP